jgi:hypothetical protein
MSYFKLYKTSLKVLTFAVVGFASTLPATALQFRSIDGSGNNLIHPDWGKAGSELLRLSDPAYDDGYDSPRATAVSGNPLPYARDISNVVASQIKSIPNSIGASDWLWQWGQFLDHDFGLNEPSATNPITYIPVHETDVATGQPDPLYTPQGIRFQRNDVYPGTGTSLDNPRQQFNVLTSYLDGSAVYGSTQAVADALRTFNGGKLKSQIINGEELLPFKSWAGMEVVPLANPLGLSPDQLFVAGDARVNEQVGLTAVHTLLMREHNRLAQKYDQKITANKPGDPIVDLFDHFLTSDAASNMTEAQAKDEFVYQIARKVVGAEIQAITYKEFLPMLVGKKALSLYDGYQDDVDVTMSNEFSNAAFRLGHTLLSDQLLRINNDREVIGSIPLGSAFFNPQNVIENGVDTLLMGLVFQPAQEFDNMLVDGVRNQLFAPNSGGRDLATVNIMRGRDVGLDSLNNVREALGLPRYTSFKEINPDPKVWQRLAAIYDSVDDVDLWIGGISEKHYTKDALLGETFGTIVVDQFTRLRDGDRFFYLNELSDLKVLLGSGPKLAAATLIPSENLLLPQKEDLDSDLLDMTLSKLVYLNSTMNHMPDDALVANDPALTPEPSSIISLLVITLLGLGMKGLKQ